jgi:hypothetical protein
MITRLATLIAALLFAPSIVGAQNSVAAPERGIYLTMFRSPATGIELRNRHVGVQAGFYPTIISRDGERGNVNFIRAGFSYYLNESGSTLYVTPSVIISLDEDWDHGALTELGFRGRLYRALNGRLGVGVLTTIDGEVRVNPTVGFDVRVGGRR